MSANTDIAKAPILAYNEKNWERVKETVAATVVYDEVGTQRKLTGVNEVVEGWKGWAKALPDSKATIHSAVESGNTVTIELTWKGTHNGPLQTADREIPASGNPVELRACQVVEIADGKAKTIRQYFDIGTLVAQIEKR
jgi:steroid delta-isomerase-like uncharacterized protein